MFRKTILASLTSLVVIVLSFSMALLLTKFHPASISVQLNPHKPITWGTIDSQNSLQSNQIVLEERTLSWKQDNAQEFSKTVNQIIRNNHVPVISLLPQLLFGEKTSNAPSELSKPVYNSIIESICRAQFDNLDTLYLQFAPQMDQKSLVRPWATDDNYSYIDMFNNFVTTCKATGNNTFKFAWSPAVEGDFMKFKPADDYIDIVGLSFYAREANPVRNPQETITPSFKNLFDPKYEAVKRLQKPVMISEMGVAGTPDFQDSWLRQAGVSINTSLYQRYLQFVIYNQNLDYKINDTTFQNFVSQAGITNL